MTWRSNFGKLGCIAMVPLLLLLVMPLSASAETYTRANFLFVDHAKPLTFTAATDGGFVGVTEDGKSFRQVPVITAFDHRLHRFEIDQTWFYVSKHGTFQASTDLVALSIYSYLNHQAA